VDWLIGCLIFLCKFLRGETNETLFWLFVLLVMRKVLRENDLVKHKKKTRESAREKSREERREERKEQKREVGEIQL